MERSNLVACKDSNLVACKDSNLVACKDSNLVARGNSDTELSSIMGEACCTPSHVWLRKGGFIKYSAAGCHAPAVRALDAHVWVGTQWRTGVIHATQQNVPRWVVRLGTMLGQGGESRASKGSGRCRVGHGGCTQWPRRFLWGDVVFVACSAWGVGSVEQHAPGECRLRLLARGSTTRASSTFASSFATSLVALAAACLLRGSSRRGGAATGLTRRRLRSCVSLPRASFSVGAGSTVDPNMQPCARVDDCAMLVTVDGRPSARLWDGLLQYARQNSFVWRPQCGKNVMASWQHEKMRPTSAG
jgi:hypothetical protein